MVESEIHQKLKEEVKDRYKGRYNLIFEFPLFNRVADIVLFDEHKIYAIIECKNKQFKKSLFQKFKYWEDKGIKAKYIVYSTKTNQKEELEEEFKSKGIIYRELNINSDDWKGKFNFFPTEVEVSANRC